MDRKSNDGKERTADQYLYRELHGLMVTEDEAITDHRSRFEKKPSSTETSETASEPESPPSDQELPPDAEVLYTRVRRGNDIPSRLHAVPARDSTRKIKIRRPPASVTDQAGTDPLARPAPPKLIEGWEMFCAGKVAEAETCFRAVLEGDFENKEAHNNLGVVAFRSNDLETAEEHFSMALLIDPEYQDAINNLEAVRNRNNVGIPSAGPEKASKNTLVDARLAIINPFESRFSDVYTAHFSRNNEVRLLKPTDTKELSSVSEWADIVWTTWANEPLVMLSRMPGNAALVTHIRSYEILTPELMGNIRWQNVAGAVFVAEHIREMANCMWGLQLARVQQTTVTNCVKLSEYPLHQGCPGYNIAFVGYMNHKKGIGLLLQCIKEAVDLDPRYHLHIAGEFQETRFEVYTQHLLAEMGLFDHVTFHGWVVDIPEFLKDMNYILSTSPWEGCPNNIIEAMACGTKPLIHNWRGSKQLFPEKQVFNTVGDFLRLLVSNDYSAVDYRRHVEQYFNAETNLPRIDAFLAEVLERHEGPFAQ